MNLNKYQMIVENIFECFLFSLTLRFFVFFTSIYFSYINHHIHRKHDNYAIYSTELARTFHVDWSGLLVNCYYFTTLKYFSLKQSPLKRKISVVFLFGCRCWIPIKFFWFFGENSPNLGKLNKYTISGTALCDHDGLKQKTIGRKTKKTFFLRFTDIFFSINFIVFFK